MNPRRIHIVGIYGSGKSHLANKLSKLLKIKSYELDEIKYKRKYDQIRDLKEILKIVQEISNKKSWITEGTWFDYALPLYKKADLVILLNIPKSTTQKRILLRYFKRLFHKQKYFENNLKKTIRIMKKVDSYFNDPNSFITLNKHKKYIKKHAKKSITIRNQSDIKELLEKLN